MEPVITESTGAAFSITELISSLRFSFHKSEFESVAVVLQGREDILKRYITLLIGRLEAIDKNHSDMERTSAKILQEKAEIEVELKKYVRICQDLTEKYTVLEKKIERVSNENVELEVKLRHSMCERDECNLKLAELEKRSDELLVEKLEAEVAASKYKADSHELRKKYADLEKKMEKIEAEKLCVVVDSENKLAHTEENLALAKENLDKVKNELQVLCEKENTFTDLITNLEKEKDEEIEKLRSEVVRLSDELEKEKSDNKEEVSRLNEEIVCLFDERNKAMESARNWEEQCQQCQPRLSKLEQDMAAFLHSDTLMTGRLKESPSVQILLGDEAASPESPASGPNPSDVECGNRIPIQKQELHRSGPTDTAINHVIMIDSDDDTPVNNLDDVPVIKTASALKESKDRKRPQCNNDGDSQYKKSKVNSPSANNSKTDEDDDSSDESISDEAMNKLIKQIRKRNRTFTSEADMLSEFNKDDEFCVNAVCALYRRQKSVEHTPATNDVGFSAADATGGSVLAEFIINGDPQGKPQRSLNELEQHNGKGLTHCRRIARNHLKQLFQIYQVGEDPFFHHPS